MRSDPQDAEAQAGVWAMLEPQKKGAARHYLEDSSGFAADCGIGAALAADPARALVIDHAPAPADSAAAGAACRLFLCLLAGRTGAGKGTVTCGH